MSALSPGVHYRFCSHALKPKHTRSLSSHCRSRRGRCRRATRPWGIH